MKSAAREITLGIESANITGLRNGYTKFIHILFHFLYLRFLHGSQTQTSSNGLLLFPVQCLGLLSVDVVQIAEVVSTVDILLELKQIVCIGVRISC